jgi:inosine-uridine nucleoside N-ribohydrolase
VLVTGDVLRRVRGAQGSVSPFSAAVEALLLFFAATYKSVFGFDDPPLHDPVAVAYVVNPSLFKTRHMRVDIEVGSQLSAGQTVHDVWGQTGRAKNCVVAESVDVSAFWDLLLDALARAGAVSPLNK